MKAHQKQFEDLFKEQIDLISLLPFFVFRFGSFDFLLTSNYFTIFLRDLWSCENNRSLRSELKSVKTNGRFFKINPLWLLSFLWPYKPTICDLWTKGYYCLFTSAYIVLFVQRFPFPFKNLANTPPPPPSKWKETKKRLQSLWYLDNNLALRIYLPLVNITALSRQKGLIAVSEIALEGIASSTKQSFTSIWCVLMIDNNQFVDNHADHSLWLFAMFVTIKIWFSCLTPPKHLCFD